MAELLIKATDSPVPDSAGKWYAARIVYVGEDGHQWGGREAPPDFYILKVPGISKADADQYLQEWRHGITYSVVNSQPALDGYRIKATSDAVNSQGKGTITLAQVEAFFTKWKATIQSSTADSVTFDISIFNALTSQGFWERDLTGITFTETQYNQSTGSHLIKVTGATSEQIQQQCQMRGVAYVAPSSFLATRAEARQMFEEDIASAFREIMVERRRWYISAAGMTALQNAGGILTVTPAQAIANLVDGFAE